MEENKVVETVNEQAEVKDEKKAPRRGGKNDRRGQRRPRREEVKEFEEKTVFVNHISKVVKGGRHYRFAALVVVGDKKGRIGIGTGKALEVPDAVKKASEDAKKHIVSVPVVNSTIPHEIVGIHGAARVYLKPAVEGTGIIAGGPVRAVVELAGIQNIVSKSIGSSTAINMVRATFDGLTHLRTAEQVAALRGIDTEKVLG